MSDYRRWYEAGGMYFLTVVTYNRRPILSSESARSFLSNAIATVRKSRPFHLVAIVLLPDHWHTIFELPHGDDDFSTRMKRIKEEFTKQWVQADLPECRVTKSQQKKGERGVWQPRFWEHCIKDEDDLENCTDYIHWNPRKHGLVSRVADWPYSSFHRFVQLGSYDISWGGEDPDFSCDDRSWGEPT